MFEHENLRLELSNPLANLRAWVAPGAELLPPERELLDAPARLAPALVQPATAPLTTGRARPARHRRRRQRSITRQTGRRKTRCGVPPLSVSPCKTLIDPAWVPGVHEVIYWYFKGFSSWSRVPVPHWCIFGEMLRVGRTGYRTDLHGNIARPPRVLQSGGGLAHVTRRAETLPIVELVPKQSGIATMRADVVDQGGGGDDSFVEATGHDRRLVVRSHSAAGITLAKRRGATFPAARVASSALGPTRLLVLPRVGWTIAMLYELATGR